MVMKQIYRNCHGDETDLQKLSWWWNRFTEIVMVMK
jgi:hypothetical protein